MLVDPTGMVSTATCPEDQRIHNTLAAGMYNGRYENTSSQTYPYRWLQMCELYKLFYSIQ